MGDELDFTSDFYGIEAVLEKRDRELLSSVRKELAAVDSSVATGLGVHSHLRWGQF